MHNSALSKVKCGDLTILGFTAVNYYPERHLMTFNIMFIQIMLILMLSALPGFLHIYKAPIISRNEANFALLPAINKNNCFINMTNDEFTFVIYSSLTCDGCTLAAEFHHLIGPMCCKP